MKRYENELRETRPELLAGVEGGSVPAARAVDLLDFGFDVDRIGEVLRGDVAREAVVAVDLEFAGEDGVVPRVESAVVVAVESTPLGNL